MAKLTLTDVVTGFYSTTLINANNALIETALENTISRDGTSPNQMNAHLDLNSYKVINAADATASTDLVNLKQLQAASIATDIPDPTGNGGKYLRSDGIVDGWELANIQELVIAGGTADVMTGSIDATVAMTATYDGLIIPLKALSTPNTSLTPTFNLNGLGGKIIVKENNTTLTPGDILGTVFLRYDGSLDKWILMNPRHNLDYTPTVAINTSFTISPSLYSGYLVTTAPTTANITITLPDPSTTTCGVGTRFKFVKLSGNTYTTTIQRGGTKTINGLTSVVLTNTYDYIEVYYNGTNWYIIDQGPEVTLYKDASSTTSTPIALTTALVETAWESIGPTGSGATNIWTELDNVPPQATYIIVAANSNMNNATAGTKYIQAYWREYGSATGTTDGNVILYHQTYLEAAVPQLSSANDVMIPLDSSRRFEAIWWGTAATAENLSLYLKGWGTGSLY